MTNIGITGQNGFIGTHLYNTLGMYPEKYNRIVFEKEWYEQPDNLDEFVKQCDVIVHLAAVNRHKSQDMLYYFNVRLTEDLINAMYRTRSNPQVIFTSSVQENQDNLYGK